MNDVDFALAFRAEQREIFVTRLRVALYYMAVPLVLSFSAIDYFYAPAQLITFLKLRLLVVPVALICFHMYRLELFRQRHYAVPAHIFTVFLGLLNGYMAMKTGGARSSYYAGLNLVGVGACAFLPWTVISLFLSALTIYSPYALMLAASSEPFELGVALPNFAFMVSTIFLGGIITYYFRNLRLEELKSRLKLEREIRDKAEIIERKTREGVFLQKLASQFSPQVVEAIKAGDISISERLRRPVACIFIDVENSTKRSMRLDHTEYTSTLADFFNCCVEVLLKHDVTIGTYLGDGLLAFTNAPQESSDYRIRAIRACMDILAMHSRRKPFYNDKWRCEFNIRIGINDGYAHIGFFPNIEHGTYTVVGDTVNLAARLCGKAEQNRVCVTKGFLKSVNQELGTVQAKHQEACETIKGFEGELFELFSLSNPNAVASVQSGREQCPLCTENLVLQADFGESMMIKCPKCGYTDIADKPAQLSKAA